ncbi:MAG: ABC transporter permease [Clostridia bacterium]|nr:ABC transporter permease [Clostridia bacterium]
MNRTGLWFRILRRQAGSERTSYLALAVCLAVAILVTQVHAGVLDADRIRTLHTYGYQHGLFADCPQELAAELADDARVKELGFSSIYGFAANPDSDASDPVPLGDLDETARRLADVGLLTGRWPERGNEIAMEQSALYVLRLRAQAGDPVELAVSVPSGREDGEAEIRTLTFRLVGILADYSSAHYHPAESESSAYGLPGVILAGVPGANDFGPGTPAPNELSRTAWVRLKPGIPYVPFFREIAARHALPLDRYYLNTMAYKPDASLDRVGGGLQTNHSGYTPPDPSGQETDETSNSAFVLITILVVLLLALSALLFTTTLSMRRKSHAAATLRLRLAGASSRQVVLSAILQDVLSLAVLLPVGSATGILAAAILGWTVLPRHVPFFSPGIHADPLWWIWLTFSVGLAVGTAIAQRGAMRRRPLDTVQDPSGSAKGKPSRSSVPAAQPVRPAASDIRHPLALWAGRSFRENRIALSGVMVSLGLCLAILMIASYVLGILNLANRYASPFDVQLTHGSTTYMSSLRIPVMQARIDREDLSAIHGLHEVRSMVALSRHYMNLLTGPDEPEDGLAAQLRFEDPTDPERVSDADIALHREEMRSFGYADSERILTGSVTGIDMDTLDRFRPYVVEGEIHADALMSGSEVLLVVADDGGNGHVGDRLVFTQIVNPTGSTRRYSTVFPDVDWSGWERRDVEVTVGAVVRPDASDDAFPVRAHQGWPVLVWGDPAFRLFGLDGSASSVMIQMQDYRDDAAVRDEIARLGSLYPAMRVELRSEAEQREQSGNRTALALAYGTLVLLAGFALFIVYSFSQMLAARNRRLIGALRAGGLSLDRMRRVKALESGGLVLVAVLAAHLIGLGFAGVFLISPNRITVSTWNQILDVFRFYPAVPMLVLIPVLYGLVYLFQMAPIRRLYRLPVCELIREE